MTKQLKQTPGSSASPTSGLTKPNFDVLFSNPVNIGGNKVAFRFTQYNLHTSIELQSAEYNLYIKTGSGNVYQLMGSNSSKLATLVQMLGSNPYGGKLINGNPKGGYPLPDGFYLFNPKTNTISQVNNPLLNIGKPYFFKEGSITNGNTTPISEIVLVADCIGRDIPNNIPSSFIDYEFKQLSKNFMNKPFTVVLL